MNQRKPFFSVVVPCYVSNIYDSNRLKRLLNSIKIQQMNDDIEIVLSDDCSTESIQSVIDQFSKQLKITHVFTDGVCSCPGNTRERGVKECNGEWLVFADQDDIFVPGAFAKVREKIISKNEQRLVCSNFIKVAEPDLDTPIEKFDETTCDLFNWVHGKFFNLENFWKKYDIHFIKDLKTHEDLAIGTQIRCAIMSSGINKCVHVNDYIYRWVYHSDSVSHSQYVTDKQGHTFGETHFEDWLASNPYIYIDRYDKGYITVNHAIQFVVPALIEAYNACLNWKLQHPDNYVYQNDLSCIRLWQTFKKTCNVVKSAIKVVIATQYSEAKKEADKFAEYNGVETLYQWIDRLDSSVTVEIASGKNRCDRPFFSLVIACYNDGRYSKGNYIDKLLTSVCDQGLNREDIEVILSDDCSPNSYDDIIAPFRNKLNIVTTKTDYNFAPGNTRQKGVDIAKGKWLCFADHDDVFYPRALKAVKDYIDRNCEKYYVYTTFNGVDSEGKVLRNYRKTAGWCHGKFYNLDNLWKANGIHFIKDLKSHEDVAICTQVSCTLDKLKVKPNYFDFITYAWTDNPQSVSHAKYTVETEEGLRNFLEVFFDDYLHATGYIYIDNYKNGMMPKQYSTLACMEVLCYAYSYLQTFQFQRKDYWKKNWVYAGSYLAECKKLFDFKSNQSVYDFIAKGNGAIYYAVREQAELAGKCIPQQGFKQWLDAIDREYKKSL